MFLKFKRLAEALTNEDVQKKSANMNMDLNIAID